MRWMKEQKTVTFHFHNLTDFFSTFKRQWNGIRLECICWERGGNPPLNLPNYAALRSNALHAYDKAKKDKKWIKHLSKNAIITLLSKSESILKCTNWICSQSQWLVLQDSRMVIIRLFRNVFLNLPELFISVHSYLNRLRLNFAF